MSFTRAILKVVSFFCKFSLPCYIKIRWNKTVLKHFFNFRDRAHVGCHWAVEFKWTRRDGPSCASSPSATTTRLPKNSSSSSPTSAPRTPPPTLELFPQTPPARCSNNYAQADERTKVSPKRKESRGFQLKWIGSSPIIGRRFYNGVNWKPARLVCPLTVVKGSLCLREVRVCLYFLRSKLIVWQIHRYRK